MGENAIAEKSKNFAVRTVNLYKFLCEKKHEFVLSKQLLKSGTSIGANVHEALFTQSRKEFISKMSLALKETNETEYWLEVLYKTDYISEVEYKSIIRDVGEVKALLIAIYKTSRKRLNEK